MSGYKIFSRTEKSRDWEHKVNEDQYFHIEYSFMNDEKLLLIILADGMGGLSQGDQASYNAVYGFASEVYQHLLKMYMDNSREDFSMTYYAGDMEQILKNAMRAANKNVCDHADPYEPTGTTLSVVAVLGGYAIAANVGDSPIYYYSARTKEFRLISELHTKAEKDVEAGMYDRYSAQYYENDHIIYRSLGTKNHLEDEDIYVRLVGYLEQGDMFLVGSDGAFGHMREEEIYQVVSQAEDGTVLKELFEKAREDKDDDQTAVLYRM